jgi:hypothetical protein
MHWCRRFAPWSTAKCICRLVHHTRSCGTGILLGGPYPKSTPVPHSPSLSHVSVPSPPPPPTHTHTAMDLRVGLAAVAKGCPSLLRPLHSSPPSLPPHPHTPSHTYMIASPPAPPPLPASLFATCCGPPQVDPRVAGLAAAVRGAGMQAGIALKPATPAELVLPYVEAGLIDMVSGGCWTELVVEGLGEEGTGGRGGSWCCLM